MVNLSASQRINLGARLSESILLLRYYMVARENNPYLLRLSLDGVVVDEIPVCMSESRLTRMHLDRKSTRLNSSH